MSIAKIKISNLFNLPFNELLFQAQSTHRQNFNNQEIELCVLLSIKTGSCPEDCKYCPQSGHYNTGLKKEKLIDISSVIAQAKAAKEAGAKRYCMGAAWRNPPKKQMEKIVEMVKEVKGLGLETCMTLGMLNPEQAKELKTAGLDYYNHNLDTSPEFYGKIISTRTYDDRLETLKNVRNSNIKVCCGGILGMGETREDRIGLLEQLANLPSPPESVPINQLIPIPGTPLGNLKKSIDPLEFIRTIAVARIIMPKSMVRLSAGRENMSDEMQALCFMAGANSIFYGDKLLTASNNEKSDDMKLFERLGMTSSTEEEHETVC
jgi:biotin synthase